MLSIGVGGALTILYDYLSSPHLISREQAFEYALKFGGFNKTQFVNYTVDMKLLQTKSPGVALVLDDKTLKNEMSAVPQVYRSELDEYVWQVKIDKKFNEYRSHEWRYFIDAINGTLVDSFDNDIIYPRSLNHTSSS